ncbi:MULTISPECIES: hypothetical protein [unclassified Streptomyces]|uniref:hypothetical protein n=1 Tax=unclassified Streptomyces TaxID=2593676 RepID=UPI002DD9DD37|nr:MULTISPECIES: hypothetical protein [unclassified Streptomyces]WSF82418.1 hypothetical protein OIE70_04310 [Streptomyces sp. NBC_01744]WSC41288.1 hypothetical protein OHA08_40770 [Streptomyces sp. NBC_01763]WSC49676.1 hypothetical protein OIE61_40490 [Streptomyces sp. NBC_01762]WSC51568.1 hypothetical protein OG808_04170 [Streptomyces sp. NBC_01761]WSD29253.1 hypothetical protein OHA26_40840 [Streptomyces sp. NBC_01751]
MSTPSEDLHRAVADVMHAHGYGIVSRLVFVVELIDEETGGLGLLRGSTPSDMPVWSELGLCQFAIADIPAAVTADRTTQNDEED